MTPSGTAGKRHFSPMSFMKAIDKSRFKPFLSPEEEALGNAAGATRR